MLQFRLPVLKNGEIHNKLQPVENHDLLWYPNRPAPGHAIATSGSRHGNSCDWQCANAKFLDFVQATEDRFIGNYKAQTITAADLHTKFKDADNGSPKDADRGSPNRAQRLATEGLRMLHNEVSGVITKWRRQNR